MHFRYGLYFIVLLIAGCNIKHPEKVSYTLKPPERAEVVADNENKQLECVERLDAGVEIIAMTEQWAQQMGLMDLYQADPGFDKWCVLFHDIPGSPPYTFQQKRLSQALPDRYYPCPGPSSENILECKNCNMATGLVVSARGYLPGEKVMIRLSAKDAYREAIFYPRSLLLKKESGELLAKGTLLCAEPGRTLYNLDICGVGKHEKYKLVSHSGKESLLQDLQGPIRCGLTPEVVGMVKGIAKMELQFEDGAFYTMELPWGYELLEYKLGNK
jgi:hypothetical protein